MVTAELLVISRRLRAASRAWDSCLAALADDGAAVVRALEQLDKSTQRNRTLLLPYRRFLRRAQSPAAQALWQAYRWRVGSE